MPKARAGQAARRKQDRERAALEHREELAAQAAAHAPAPIDHDASDATTDHRTPAGLVGSDTSDLRPVSGIASGPNEETTVMADLAEAVETAPATAPPAASDGTVDARPSSQPSPSTVPDGTGLRFAPVPRPTTKGGPTMTDDSAAPAAPRGRMTDRYTVWSSAARGSIAIPAESPAGDPPGASGPAADAIAPEGGDVPGLHEAPAGSAGYDLAVARLDRATTGPATEKGGDPAIDRMDDLLSEAIPSGSTGLGEATGAGTLMTDAATGATFGEPATGGDVAAEATGVDIDAPEAHGATSDAEMSTPVGQAEDVIAEDRRHAAAPAEAGRSPGQDAPDQVGVAAAAGTDQAREAAAGVGSDIADAGNDIAATLAGGADRARVDIAGAVGDLTDGARAAGREMAGVAGERLDEAEDRIEETVDQVVETGRTAASEIAGTVGRATADVRADLSEAAQDLIETGRETVSDARRIAADAVTGARSGVADAASSIGGTAQETAGLVGERLRQATQSVGQTVSGTAGSVAGLARGAGTRSGTGSATDSTPETGPSASGSQSVRPGGQARDYSRLVISLLALGLSSGLTRWAVRRLTGADIALLGPSRVRPAILGPGIAALVASLYLSDEDAHD